MREELEELQKELTRRKAVTAVELSRVIRCSVPTVYRRLERLKLLGAVIAELSNGGAQKKKTGPVPVKFLLVREVPAREVG